MVLWIQSNIKPSSPPYQKMQFTLKKYGKHLSKGIDTIFEYIHYKTIFDKTKYVEKVVEKLKEAWIDKKAEAKRPTEARPPSL